MSMTILDHLVSSLRQAANYNRHDLAAPRVVLWTDGEQLWSKVVTLVGDAMPELLVLNGAPAENRQGPSTWIRYHLARGEWRDIPVIYLPGVPRHAFRGAAGFPDAARHLFALQYQGQFWTQLNGKDWTPFAFLSSEEGGLGLDVARDRPTLDALTEQLENVLRTPLTELQGPRLESGDFHKLAADDPVRMVLQWMASPDAARSRWEPAQWNGFRSICKRTYNLDPEKDGLITAAEKLVVAEGAWGQVWGRYREAPKAFGGVRKALDLVHPKDLFGNSNERIPANNKRQEENLRKGFDALTGLPKGEALKKLAELCATHAKRAQSLWAELSEAPLACAAFHLEAMVGAIRSGSPAHAWRPLTDHYLDQGWIADASAWKAVAAVRDTPDLNAVTAALQATYVPWLEGHAERVGSLVSSYPAAGASSRPELEALAGTAVVFVDGLRCDLGLELQRMLKEHDFEVKLDTYWSALPTVTATAKPAWRPLANHLKGDELSEGFEPQQRDSGRPLKTLDFRKLIDEIGFTWAEPTALGNPNGCCWTEAGAFDRYGHEQGARLAWRIDEELRAVVHRIRELLQGGWKKVVVITDHGWLYAPGGLPTVKLPQHLTLTKWGRCAIAQPGAQHGHREVSWFWGAHHAIVLAPGISVFRDGTEYAHGGLSLQEALTPVLTVTGGVLPEGDGVSIASAKWLGLRLQVTLEGTCSDVALDLRTNTDDPSSSVLPAERRMRAPDADGKVSLLVDRDELMGQAAVLVVVRRGKTICKRPVAIGED